MLQNYILHMINQLNVIFMELKKEYQNVCCIYKLINKANGKIMIGCTTNMYNRVSHYRNDIHKQNPLKHYNLELYTDIIKYGINNFDFEIIETFDNITDIDLKNKEKYYILKFKSNDLNIGYNIRMDENGKYITAQSTIGLKRQQTKDQWDSGLRDEHSNKMKDYWNNVSEDRKEQQRNIMKKNLTKYVYTFYDAKTNEIVYNKISYREIKELGHGAINAEFCRKGGKTTFVSNGIVFSIPKNHFKIHYKNFIVERININN